MATHRTLNVIVCSGLSLLLTAPIVEAQPANKIVPSAATQLRKPEAAVLKGDELRAGQRPQNALEAYSEASDAANDLPAATESGRTEKAAALLSTGQAYLRLLNDANSEVRDQALGNAQRDFEAVIEHGDAAQQSIGRVHLADVHFRAGRPKDALAVLQQCDRSQIAESQHFVLDYNLGRGYQTTGQPKEALAAYQQSLIENPQFTQAADRIVELAAESSSADLLRQSSDTLMSDGYLDHAMRLSETVLNRERGQWRDPAMVHSLTTLLRCWAWQFDGPNPEIVARCSGQLAQAGLPDSAVQDFQKVAAGNVSVSTNPIRGGYDGLHPDLSDFWPRLRHSKGLESLGAAWSVYVEAIARWHAAPPAAIRKGNDSPRKPEIGLALYLIAWGLDRNNLEASNGLLALLEVKEYAPLIEPLFQQVFDALFDAKNELYIARPRSASDWESILQFHIVLGTMAANHDAMGEPGSSPMTAIGQWELGSKAEMQAIENSKGEFRGSPTLHVRLARAYSARDRNDLAIDEWLTALQRSIDIQDLVPAKLALKRAEELLASMSAPQLDRFQSLGQRLQQISDTPH